MIRRAGARAFPPTRAWCSRTCTRAFTSRGMRRTARWNTTSSSSPRRISQRDRARVHRSAGAALAPAPCLSRRQERGGRLGAARRCDGVRDRRARGHAAARHRPGARLLDLPRRQRERRHRRPHDHRQHRRRVLHGLHPSTNFPTQKPAAGRQGRLRRRLRRQAQPDGALVYSTYLGGGDEDFGSSVAVDGAGNAYVIGSTSSAELPDAEPLPVDQPRRRCRVHLEAEPDRVGARVFDLPRRQRH